MKKRYSENRLYEAHEKEGIKRYGKRRWNNANIGWYSENGVICSKVYSSGSEEVCMILTTSYENGKFIHGEEEY